MNKVLFGFSDLYIGEYITDEDGNVTLGTPYHQRGAVGFSPDENSDSNDFYADNVPYYSTFSSGTREGDLEVAMFDDAFKTRFSDYIQLDDGGIAQVKNKIKPNIYVMFEVQGDEEARRIIMYNGTLGPIQRAYSTIEETKEPVTETTSTKFVGDNKTGITIVTYRPEDAPYATLFTNPPVPALPAESE